MKISPALSFYSGVFALSTIVMAMQILQSRIFSVTTWYHLSFLVISVAMFGMTLGALHVYRGDEKFQRENFAFLSCKASVYCGISIFFALLVQLYCPIVSTDFIKTFFVLPFVAIPTSLPYYFAGVAITLCLTRAPYPVARTYGLDLLGAGLGCIGALVLMETIDTPSALLFLCALCGGAAFAFYRIADAPQPISFLGRKFLPAKAVLMLALVPLVFMMVNAALPVKIFSPFFVKGKVREMSYDHDKWNSISRITVHHEKIDAPPFLWGPSPLLPENFKADYKWLIIDGDAGTPITRFDGKNFSAHAYLEYDVTNLAYNLPDIQVAAIIGVGGGRDALSAKYFNVPMVYALDVNPVQIDLLSRNPAYTGYSNLARLPGMHFITSEARSWFRSTEEKFDLVQMSLIDTWAATGAGAFALSENGLYTREAWQIFIDSLTERGVFTVSRWSADYQDDSGRLLALAVSTLLERGAANPQDHIFLSTSDNIVNLIVAKNPLSDAQLRALNSEADRCGFKIISTPNMNEIPGLTGEIIAAESVGDLKKLSDRQIFDITPPTDMRPFFFNQAKFSNPLAVIKTSFFGRQDRSGILMGQVKATFNLFVIILMSAVVVVVVILRPLSQTVKNTSTGFVRAGSFYFLLIGLGFMLIEVSLLQAFGVFLGHPVYGLGIVLFSLILSAGAGSLISEKLPLSTMAARTVWSGFTCVYIVALALFLDDVFGIFARATLVERAALSVGLIFPAGMLMGYGFPTGIRLVQAIDTRATSWFWGINGAAGVLGGSVAIALNISIGIDKTLLIGALCYALLSVCMVLLARARPVQAGT